MEFLGFIRSGGLGFKAEDLGLGSLRVEGCLPSTSCFRVLSSMCQIPSHTVRWPDKGVGITL